MYSLNEGLGRQEKKKTIQNIISIDFATVLHHSTNYDGRL